MLNFQNWFYKSSLHTIKGKSKVVCRLSNFANPFIHPCDGQVSNKDDLFWFHQHAPCFCRLQMPYMYTIQALHWNLSVPYLFSQFVSFTPSILEQSWRNLTFLKLCKSSQISHQSPRVETTPKRTKTNHHWLNHLQPILITLIYANPLAVGLRGSSQTPGVKQGNPSSFPWLTPETKR